MKYELKDSNGELLNTVIVDNLDDYPLEDGFTLTPIPETTPPIDIGEDIIPT
jgi:hypothetical protein